MNKTVASVIEDINEWENPHGGSVFYVTAICTDEDVLSVGRKDMDAALEVKGLLQEAIGVEQDFVLEPAKPTKTGRTKWKVLGFGTPGGAATYTAPGVQGAGSENVTSRSARPPEHDQEDKGIIGYTRRVRPPEHDVDASIRAAVALKAAASSVTQSPGIIDVGMILKAAERFDAWLKEKASEPASSAYESGSGTDSRVDRQAGAGSEELPQESRPDSTLRGRLGNLQSAIPSAGVATS